MAAALAGNSSNVMSARAGKGRLPAQKTLNKEEMRLLRNIIPRN